MKSSTITCSDRDGQLDIATNTGFALKGGKGGRSGLRLTDGSELAANSAGLGVDAQVKALSKQAIEFHFTWRNESKRPIEMTSLTVFDGELELAGAGWRVAHRELFKREEYHGGYSIRTDGLFAPIPGTNGEFGLSEDLPFPGLFFTHPERGTVLMAVLSQESRKPLWRLDSTGDTIRLTAAEAFTGIPHVTIEPGAELAGERWVLLVVPGGFEDAVEKYYELLRQRISFVGERSILRRAVVWGSWNYNPRSRGHYDIDHDYVERNAAELARLFPDQQRFVMIDDGYQFGCSERRRGEIVLHTGFEFFHDDGNPPYDPALFPDGMKGIANAIRATGAKPALWTTPRLHRQSSLAKDRPDWLLHTEDGKDFGERSAYLDYSLPEVREFARDVWKTIFGEWDFTALKLDFWTIPYEMPGVRFKDPSRTATEWRNQFLRDLREFVPDDGYVITAVVTNCGNPFVGRHVDATRMGRDISSGTWNDVVETAVSVTTSAPFHRHDCLLPDADSIGWHPDLPANENRLWATLAFLSGAVCEIGGDLTKLTPEARESLTLVGHAHGPKRRTLSHLDDGRINSLPPNHVILDTEDGTYEGLLNWSSHPREVQLPNPVEDLWTKAKLDRGRHQIPPRDAIMFTTT